MDTTPWQERRVAVWAAIALAVLGATWAWHHLRPRAARTVERHVEPTLAAGKDGELSMAWMAARSGGATHLGVRFSRDHGAHWEAPSEVRDPGGRYVADPTLVADPGGGFHLAFLSFRATPGGTEPWDMRVSVAHASKGATRFDPPVPITASGTETRFDKPWAVATTLRAGGDLAVVYGFERPPHAGIEVSIGSLERGFRRSVVAEGEGFSGTLATICASPDGRRTWVAWVDPNVGVVVRAGDLVSGFAKGMGSLVSRPGEKFAIDAPSCASGEGDDVWVSYGIAERPFHSGHAASLVRIVVAHSGDGGRTFSEAKSFEERGQRALFPQLSRAPSGPPVLAFLSGRGDGDENASLRLLRLADDVPTTVRGGLRYETGKRNRFWPGDYFGMAWDGAPVFAVVAPRAGVPRISFERAR